MSTKRETILQALFAALASIAGPVVLRNEVLPERISAQGMLIMRDGNPGEPDVLISPPEYVYEHFVEVEVVVAGKNPAARDAVFDGLMQAIATAIYADRTLGGLCDYLEAQAPEPIDLPIEGTPGLKAAILPIILYYGSSDPLN